MSIPNMNRKKNLEKELYKDPPLLEENDLETLIEESIKILYEDSGTQEELYSLKEKKIEGFEEYFKLLEKDGLDQNKTFLDAPTPKKIEINIIKINK